MSVQTDRREPSVFAAGDTLAFQKYLRDYLPDDGWSLQYQLRDENGNIKATVESTQLGSAHLVEENGFADGLPSDSYVLAGYAINGAERQQIYSGELTLTANLGNQTKSAPLATHAQRMIKLIEASLERLAVHELDDTNVQQTEIRRTKRIDLEKQLAMNKEIRANELRLEAQRNGRGGSGQIMPIFHIVG
jgi:hypothetical protein